MQEFLSTATWYCVCLVDIAAALVLIIKPLRQRVLGIKDADDGVKCLLRSDMLRTYYRHREAKQIRQFEYENFILMYKAYKAKGGNSFIDHIKGEVDEWEVIS